MSLNHLNSTESVGILNPRLSSLKVDGKTTLNSVYSNNDSIIVTGTYVLFTNVATTLSNGTVLKQVGSSINYSLSDKRININLGNKGVYLINYSIVYQANGVGQRSSQLFGSSGITPNTNIGRSQIPALNSGGAATWTNGSAIIYCENTAENINLSIFQDSGSSLTITYTISVIRLG